MKIVILALSLLLFSALNGVSEEPQSQENHCSTPENTQKNEHQCSMHEEHQKQMEHHQAVDERGDAVMGFDHMKTTHRFLQRDNGGVIQVTANDSGDDGSVTAIRTHLSEIARLFKAGDFEKPLAIHGQTPPGTAKMKELRDQIDYKYESLDAGGRVVIQTENPDALSAIHEFLRFQIQDHRTADELK